MAIRAIFPLVILLFFFEASGQQMSCPVRPLDDRNVTANGIGDFASRNRLSLEQTICCLPENWRRNYVIASTSPSAQGAGPHAPRIILFPSDDPRNRRSDRALSFLIDRSQGRPTISDVSAGSNRVANQRFSIEVRDEVGGSPRYSEIRFENDMARELGLPNNEQHRPTTSINERNCVECHGSPGRQYPTFSFAPSWPNTFPKFYKPTVCPTLAESNASEAERQQLLRAVSTPNSAFTCLPGIRETIASSATYAHREGEDPLRETNLWYRNILGRGEGPGYDVNVPQPSSAGLPDRQAGIVDAPALPPGKADDVLENVRDTSASLRLPLLTENFEVSLVNTYNVHFANRIRSFPNYATHKYAIAGALLGCMGSSRPNLAAWFSERQLAEQTRRFQSSNNPIIANPLIANFANRGEIERALTCPSGSQQSNFQQDCFPEGCPTTRLAGRNIATTLAAASQRRSATDPAAQADAAFMQTVAATNFDLRRNWLPYQTQFRNGDSDSWGAFRYLMFTSAPQENITAEWSQIFNGRQNNHRSVVDLGQRVMQGDPDLRQLIIPGQSSCAGLARASLQATAPAPAAPAAAATPAEGVN